MKNIDKKTEEDALDLFLNDETKANNKKSDEIVITPKTGLVERIERKLVVADGRQLLREETISGTHNII